MTEATGVAVVVSQVLQGNLTKDALFTSEWSQNMHVLQQLLRHLTTRMNANDFYSLLRFLGFSFYSHPHSHL